MTAFEREDRSFVGCGEEEYPKGDISSRTAPVGLGIHGEVLPPQVEMRLQYGDLMHEQATRSGCGGESYAREVAECDASGRNDLSLEKIHCLYWQAGQPRWSEFVYGNIDRFWPGWQEQGLTEAQVTNALRELVFFSHSMKKKMFDIYDKE